MTCVVVDAHPIQHAVPHSKLLAESTGMTRAYLEQSEQWLWMWTHAGCCPVAVSPSRPGLSQTGRHTTLPAESLCVIVAGEEKGCEGAVLLKKQYSCSKMGIVQDVLCRRACQACLLS